MSTGNEFQRQAIAAHVKQRLAGPARAILGFQELLLEQARDFGLTYMQSDLERIGAAARQLNGLIDRLVEGEACSQEGGKPTRRQDSATICARRSTLSLAIRK